MSVPVSTSGLFIIGMVAGFINVNAGGGSTLTLPALIFFGLDSAMANGTNRIGILIQNLTAIGSFRQQKVSDLRQSFMLSLLTLPGAVIGALVSIHITDVWFQRILAVVMIGIVVTMFLPRHIRDLENFEFNKRKKLWLYPALLGIGFYGGFIQVGVGFIIMAALYHLLQVSLLYVNMHKVFIIFLYTIPSLIVFAKTGHVHWLYGLVLAAGMSAGGWWGARVQVKSGEQFIRKILAVAIVLMAIKLLGTF